MNERLLIHSPVRNCEQCWREVTLASYAMMGSDTRPAQATAT
jgi:hypothetical protein